MGIPTVIFVSEPDPDLLCVICQDVPDDPYSFQCGDALHTLCRTCLERLDACTYCRNDHAVREASARNLFARNTINSLVISCKTKYADSEPGRAQAAPTGQCDWTGKLSDWEAHAKVECLFHPLPCAVEGCSFVGCRNDMKTHMEENMIAHMELMVASRVSGVKRDFEQKEQSMKEEYEQKIKSMEDKHSFQVERLKARFFSALEHLQARHKSELKRVRNETAKANDSDQEDEDFPPSINDGPAQIVIENAGSAIVNGTYEQDGYFEGACRYVKECKWNGRSARLYLLKCRISNNTKHWYISIAPRGQAPGTSLGIGLYTAPEPTDVPTGNWPPLTGWVPAKQGVPPVPTLSVSQPPVIQSSSSSDRKRRRSLSPSSFDVESLLWRSSSSSDIESLATSVADTEEVPVWFMERVCVQEKNTEKAAVIKEINAKFAQVEFEDKTSKIVRVGDIAMVTPEEHDMVLVTGGREIGLEATLVCVGGSDAVLKDANDYFRLTDIVHLVKISSD